MKIIDYFRETKGELKHVSWPTKTQTASFTIIVIIVSFVVAYFLGFFDFSFSYLISQFILNK